MTQEEKLSKAVKLADAMYYAAQMMSTDACVAMIEKLNELNLLS